MHYTYLCVHWVKETYTENKFVFNGFVESARVEITCTIKEFIIQL